ncbi:MAG TPA: hypothetical protein VLJ15_07070 [Gammaproteobacteria bacterium]|nr:hypothetical protein [Gammaproteobacteria bacterium]
MSTTRPTLEEKATCKELTLEQQATRNYQAIERHYFYDRNERIYRAPMNVVAGTIGDDGGNSIEQNNAFCLARYYFKLAKGKKRVPPFPAQKADDYVISEFVQPFKDFESRLARNQNSIWSEQANNKASKASQDQKTQPAPTAADTPSLPKSNSFSRSIG